MIGAEQTVEQRQVDGEILVHRDCLYPMVPVVEARRGDHLAQTVEVTLEVRVEQRGVDIDEADIGLHHQR